MNLTVRNLCMWSGPIAMLLFFIGIFPMAHLLPVPFPPGAPVEEMQAFYAEHRIGILLGEMVVLWASALIIPFMMVVASFMRKLEPGFPYLTSIFVFCAVIIVIEIIIPAWNFTTVVFRENRPDDVLLALTDQAFMMYVWPNPQTVLMTCSVGFAILLDKNPVRLFPRWLGYANIGMGLLYLGSTFCSVFWTGPMAWNGLLAFWVPAIDFGTWFTLMFLALQKASKIAQKEAIEI